MVSKINVITNYIVGAGFYLKFVKIFHFLFLPDIATLGSLVYVRTPQNVIFVENLAILFSMVLLC